MGAFSVRGSNGSGWSLPLFLSRISTFPSACSSSLRQEFESSIPSSNKVRDFCRGTSPLSSSCTIFSRRWRHSSNLGNELAPLIFILRSSGGSRGGSQSLQHIRRGSISSRGRADLSPLHHAAHRDQHLTRDGNAFLASRLRSPRSCHALQNRVGHRDP